QWSGKYHYDLNVRDTLFTHLNVFEKFEPKIPDAYRRSKYVVLGNIDPVLQLKVLEQIEKPRLVIGDTMNFWIDGKRKELMETLKCLDVLIINDSEARSLAHEPSLIRAAKKIVGFGPKILIIKKGEHGALLVTDSTIFSAPAYPMENIYDPTGAGDTFAGGFIGWLAKSDDVSDENLKKAVIYGSAMASFCVEKFGVEGLKDLTYLKIQDRVRAFKDLSDF
ncbi:MAG: PfkB family carbohydrate kinase, partial [Ignavibacteriales bacterium]|nr:PfkB family carbohydrate kinase [Ignavibacteriales bacterium]